MRDAAPGLFLVTQAEREELMAYRVLLALEAHCAGAGGAGFSAENDAPAPLHAGVVCGVSHCDGVLHRLERCLNMDFLRSNDLPALAARAEAAGGLPQTADAMPRDDVDVPSARFRTFAEQNAGGGVPDGSDGRMLARIAQLESSGGAQAYLALFFLYGILPATAWATLWKSVLAA